VRARRANTTADRPNIVDIRRAQRYSKPVYNATADSDVSVVFCSRNVCFLSLFVNLWELSVSVNAQQAQLSQRDRATPASVEISSTAAQLYEKLNSKMISIGRRMTLNISRLNPVYTIQPVVKLVVQPDFTTGWTNSHCSFNRLSNRVVQPDWQQVVSCKRGFTITSHVRLFRFARERILANICVTDCNY